MKATKEEAQQDIDDRDFENVIFPPKRNNIKRNCIFCGKNIKGRQEYYKHWEYSYLAGIKRWNACKECFEIAYEKKKVKKVKYERPKKPAVVFLNRYGKNGG